MHSSLEQCLRYWAEHQPNQTFFGGSNSLTYSEAEARVDALATLLEAEAPGSPVLLTGTCNSHWILHLLACMRAKRPVALLPASQITGDIGRLAAIAAATLKIDGEQWLSLQPSAKEWTAVWHRLDSALAFTSSGSTGAPRLVLRSNASLVHEGERYRMVCNLSPQDTIVAGAPLFHAFAFGAALAATLVAGATLLVPETLAPRALQELIKKQRATTLMTVPSMALALATVDAGRTVSSGLRTVVVGAGRVNPRLAANFAEKWTIAPCQNYGSSETGALLFSFPPDSSKCTGTPMPGIQCTLVAAGDLPGQLWIKQEHMPLGHLSDKGFEPPRFSPGMWWPTGDLCVQEADGSYTIVGRTGDLIRRGGHSIQPREIENALLQHPDIEDVMVKGVDSDGGEQLIEAHVQPRPAVTLTIQELCNHLKSRIADSKIPHLWQIAPIPRTWSFKAAQNRNHPEITRTHSSAADSNPAGLLMCYRKSEALLAAEEIGLFDHLDSKPKHSEMLAAELDLNTPALQLFLRALMETGIVKEVPEGWILNAQLGDSWKPMCALERELRKTWLRAGAIVDVLRTGIEARPFNHSSHANDFADAYNKVLCGPWQLAAARMCLRLLQDSGKSRPRILEIGRCIGRISNFIADHAKADCALICLAPGPPLVWEGAAAVPAIKHWAEIEVNRACFDLIIINNGIHWLAPAVAQNVLRNLVAGLSDRGVLVFLDIFLPADTTHAQHVPEAPLFLLDWITHGGTHWLTSLELLKQIEHLGLQNQQVTTLPAFNWTLITGCAPAPSTVQDMQLEGAYS